MYFIYLSERGKTSMRERERERACMHQSGEREKQVPH